MSDVMAETPPTLVGPRVCVRPGRVDDAAAICVWYLSVREAHAAVDPPRPPEFYTEAYWRSQLVRNQEAFTSGREARFFVFTLDAPEAPRGVVNLTQVFRGPFQACYLGFAIDPGLEGRGLMREAVGLVVDWAFEGWNLHRVMANHLPENQRSANLLERLGFQVEGYARDYLYIHGAWRDHVLRARTNAAWRPG